jgi:flavodoxin
MKHFFAPFVALSLILFVLTACGGTEQPNPQASYASQSGIPSNDEAPSTGGSLPPVSSTTDAAEPSAGEPTANTLVAYFSATGNTASVATTLQSILDADLYEIVPEEAYTEADLNYNTDDCRANQEQNDPNARPAISGTLENPENYEVIFLGYPIWWGQAPKILYTFLECYDFGDATIVPFCTSGSSGIGSSADALQALAPDANWLDGQRFSGEASQDEIAQWVAGLDLPT